MTRFFRAIDDLGAVPGTDADEAILLPTIIQQLVRVFSQWI